MSNDLKIGTHTICKQGMYNVREQVTIQINWRFLYPMMATLKESAQNPFAVDNIRPGTLQITGIIAKSSYSLYEKHVRDIEDEMLAGLVSITANGKTFSNVAVQYFRAGHPRFGICTLESTTVKQYHGEFDLVLEIPEAL